MQKRAASATKIASRQGAAPNMFLPAAKSPRYKTVPASGIRFVTDESLPAEGYELNVDGEGIEVRASQFPGFLYALQSLGQLLPAAVYGTEPAPDAAWEVPCVKIADAPRFAYRGMHLDVARHFFSVDEVKRYIDVMAIHKLNTLHWHLTDDQDGRHCRKS